MVFQLLYLKQRASKYFCILAKSSFFRKVFFLYKLDCEQIKNPTKWRTFISTQCYALWWSAALTLFVPGGGGGKFAPFLVILI